MKRVVLPNPPNPKSVQYMTDPGLWSEDAYRWMQQVKQLTDDANRINASPMGQQFLSTNFTTNTTVTGSTTGTDLSNFVASLVAGMTASGYISPVQKRTS